MTDNVPITAGIGTSIATQDRSGKHIQEMLPVGAEQIAVGRVNVTTTSAQAVAARADRHRIVLVAAATNTAAIDIGPTGVSSGSGFPLDAGDSLTLETVAAIFADSASGTQVLIYCEEYET